MTPKIQKVCNLYLSGMSMRKALIAAGYSEGYADHNSQKFLKNREVMNYIRARQKDEAESALADDIFLRSNLKKVILDPNSNWQEKMEARKILEKINERDHKIASKLDEIEKKLDSDNKGINITINSTPVKNDEPNTNPT